MEICITLIPTGREAFDKVNVVLGFVAFVNQSALSEVSISTLVFGTEQLQRLVQPRRQNHVLLFGAVKLNMRGRQCVTKTDAVLLVFDVHFDWGL